MREARLADETPPLPREVEARERIAAHPCPMKAGILIPGYVQMCRGRTAEGAVLAGLATAELGVGITAGVAEGFDTAAAGIPLIAFGDTLTASVMDAVFETQRAKGLRYVPQDSLAEMARAPFSWEVMSRPSVWVGILGTLAAGLAVTRLLDGPIDTSNFGKRPIIFGKEYNSAVGYPLAAGIGIGLFEHVAIAEESAFRGLLQSGWSRTQGETKGWIYGSLAFGLIHSTNVLFMDNAEDRKEYLLIGVPFLTLLGSYLGLAYQWNGYSLGPPVAIHFWYDFLLSAVAFVVDPKNSPLAMTWGIPF